MFFYPWVFRLGSSQVFLFLISNIGVPVPLGLLEYQKKLFFSIFLTVARKTINVFGKNDYTLLRGGLNSIKKDDSYQNGSCLVLTKAKLLLHEDDLRTRLTVHHH